MSFYRCSGGGNSAFVITNIAASGYIGKNGDGANGARCNGAFSLNVENFKKVTVGTVNCTQSNTYGNSTATYKLDSGSTKTLSSNAVIDLSSATTFAIFLTPSIYGNADSNRSGSVDISSLTFE